MAAKKKIEIMDLEKPELSEKAQGILAMFENVETVISVESVYAAAAEKLDGIEAYRDDGIIERLGVLCDAFNSDGDLSPMGRFSAKDMLTGYLVQRSRLEDLYRRHPEIDDEIIEKPLIITGLPRSGTTHLLNLISVDDRLRSLRYWESLEPIPSVEEQGQSHNEDPRVQRCRDELAMREEIMPLFPAMHDMHPDHIHEEIELLAMDFSTTYFELRGFIPAWGEYYTSHDQTPHYAFLKRVLKALQWLQGPKRWLLKSPQHMEQLVPLKTVFPDATFVLTHRDPTSVIASFLTMTVYGARMSRNPVKPKQLGGQMCTRMLQRLERYVEDRDQLPADQTIDVLFQDFMADDMGTIEKIYALADLPLSADLKSKMKAYVDNNPRGKHGQVVYNLQRDFGLDEDELRKNMAAYFSKFAIQAGV